MIVCKRIVVVIWLCALWGAYSCHASEREISLHGHHAVTVHGDSPAFADPAFDDSAWRRIPVPSSLRAAGIEERPDVFWYRIAFDVPPGWSSDAPAIRLGIVTRSDETFLNGVRIGGHGVIGPALSDWHIYATTQPRLYPFDPSLLRVGEQNVLAIRGAREPYIDDGGVVAGPVALVALPNGLQDHIDLRFRFNVLRGIFFGIETIVVFILLTCLAIGIRSRLLKLMSLFYIFSYIFSFEHRGVAALLDLESQGLQFAANIIGSLTVPLILEIVADIFKRPLGRLGRGLQILLVLALVSVPNTGIPLLDWWAVESNLVWHSLMLCSLIMVAVWSAQAAWQGKLHSRSMLGGLLFLTAGIAGDLLFPFNYFEQRIGLRVAEIGILLFFLSIVFIVLRSLLEREHRLLQANANIARLHEQDRVRMAHNIHDGIVQWLGIIKIKLDMMLKTASAGPQSSSPEISSLVGDVEQVIEDSRRISQDLSPGLLAQHSLIGAMQSNAHHLNSIIDIRFDVDMPDAIRLSEADQIHVYRIFQEALSNAVHHSGGTEVVVNVSQSLGHFRMKVLDDGTGPAVTLSSRGNPESQSLSRPASNRPASNKKAPARQTPGLGLTSMVARAELMGGELSVTPRPGGGTIVALTIPVGGRR